MSLTLFAADCIVLDYLHGRTLPDAEYRAAVSTAQQRLIAGTMPVFDAVLCGDIDKQAVGPWKN